MCAFVWQRDSAACYAASARVRRMPFLLIAKVFQFCYTHFHSKHVTCSTPALTAPPHTTHTHSHTHTHHTHPRSFKFSDSEQFHVSCHHYILSNDKLCINQLSKFWLYADREKKANKRTAHTREEEEKKSVFSPVRLRHVNCAPHIFEYVLLSASHGRHFDVFGCNRDYANVRGLFSCMGMCC